MGGPHIATRTPAMDAGPIYEMLGKMTRGQLANKGVQCEPEFRENQLRSFDLAGLCDFIENGNDSHAPPTNIIVCAGAGISVSAGIPDFRTAGTGLYDNLQKYDLPDPQAIFSIDYFKEQPRAFYQLAKEMWAEGVAAGVYKPTPTHMFIRLLHEKGKLLRCFTQNIDSLESIAGVPKGLVVAAHGNFDAATCIDTGEKVSVEEMMQAVTAGEDGPEGWAAMRDRHGGLCKPDIVFFGEALPEHFWSYMESDFPKCDLLLVLGTSLAVAPFSGLVNRPRDNVPRALINREAVGMRDAGVPDTIDKVTLDIGRPLEIGAGFRFDNEQLNYRDVGLLGDCDSQCLEIAERLGWREELDALVVSVAGGAPANQTQD